MMPKIPLVVILLNVIQPTQEENPSCHPVETPLTTLGYVVQVLFKRTWPRGQVPYILDKSLSWDDVKVIRKSMKLIEKLSCVRFVPRKSSEPLWVEIERQCPCDINGTRCEYFGAYANVGPLPGGKLVVSGACLSTYDPRSIALVTHELFHTLGILHHHERVDRDKYINVNFNNIQFQRWSSYKWNPLYFSNNIPYDCESLMHYSDRAFNNGKGPTMTAKFPKQCNLSKINQRPSPLDIRLINSVYRCPAKRSRYPRRLKR